MKKLKRRSSFYFGRTMRVSKKYLTMFVISCILISVLSTIVIALGQAEEKSSEGSFDETTPYSFQVDSIESGDRVEISEWQIRVVAEIIEGQDGKVGDTITIILYDLTDNKEKDSITGQGPLAVATLVKTNVDIEHQYEIRIVTKPEGRKITGIYEYSWVETKKGGGIPGFGINSIVIGFLIGSIIIWKLQRE